MSTRRRIPRRRHLAAPLVITAALAASAAACGGERVYSNPERPEDPKPVDTTAPDATAAPRASSSAPLADIPKGNGRVAKQSDGTCLYIFPDGGDDCPPEVDCNPGPPREPLAVKCPPDAKKDP